MSKIQIKQKQIKSFRECGYTVINAGYFPNIISALKPFGYTCGIYGWNSDLVMFDNIVINSGYRPHGGSRSLTSKEFKLMSEYDSKNINYKNKKRIVNNFIKKFAALQA